MSMSTRRFDWIMAGLSAGAIGGFYLSRWSYQHAQPSSSLTVWQIPLNLALIAILAFLIVNAVLGLRRGRSTRDGLPPGYGLSFIGFGILGLGTGAPSTNGPIAAASPSGPPGRSRPEADSLHVSREAPG